MMNMSTQQIIMLIAAAMLLRYSIAFIANRDNIAGGGISVLIDLAAFIVGLIILWNIFKSNPVVVS